MTLLGYPILLSILKKSRTWRKLCSTIIEHKIAADLQTMQNKFDPNYNLGNARFCDVIIYDFKGKSHLVPEDYLAAIGKDKQVMQYISHESTIGNEIKHELQHATEMQKKRGLSVK